MPTWLRTALQYAPLAERAGRGLARFVRRLRGREAPSLEDAVEANERAQAAIARERDRLPRPEDVPVPENVRGLRPCSDCGHARLYHFRAQGSALYGQCLHGGCRCHSYRGDDTPTETPRAKRGDP